MVFWPRSLLACNVILLIAVVLASQISIMAVYLAFVQKPRIEDAASLIASQILAVDRLLSALPEAERSREILEMNGAPQDALPLAQSHGLFPPDYTMRMFVTSLIARLPPNVQIRWEHTGEHRIWVRLNVAGTYDWVMLRATPAVSHILPWSLVCLLLTVATIPALGILFWTPRSGECR